MEEMKNILQKSFKNAETLIINNILNSLFIFINFI